MKARLQEKSTLNFVKHPCYNVYAHKYSRMHIPVAPKCNIKCHYCNRKYDCVNESRPGVSSEILTPIEAFDKFKEVKAKVDHLSVVGIAGPGDALANFDKVSEAIKLIKAYDPEMTFCLSTNGLNLPKYSKELLDMGINYVTITINAVNPIVGANIYEYAYDNGKKVTGKEGAQLLIERQLEGLEYLSSKGVICKVNIVMIKGINEHHIETVVKKAKHAGAELTNIMPLLPVKDTIFENVEQISKKEIDSKRNKCKTHIQQMYHCQQCRSDAIGQLENDKSHEFRGHGCLSNKKINVNHIANHLKEVSEKGGLKHA